MPHISAIAGRALALSACGYAILDYLINGAKTMITHSEDDLARMSEAEHSWISIEQLGKLSIDDLHVKTISAMTYDHAITVYDDKNGIQYRFGIAHNWKALDSLSRLWRTATLADN